MEIISSDSTRSNKFNLMWFFRRFLLMLLQPNIEWKQISEESISEGLLFKGFGLPLALFPFLLFLPFVIQPSYYLGPILGVVSALIIFGTNLLLFQVYALIFDGFASALGGTCGRINSLKLSLFSITPWIFFLGFFPLIGSLALIGQPWSFILFILGSKRLVVLPAEKRITYLIGSGLLCLVAFFLSNIFFVGVLSMILGPQAPLPQ